MKQITHFFLEGESPTLKTFIFYFFILSFPLMSSGYKKSNLQQKACMTFC